LAVFLFEALQLVLVVFSPMQANSWAGELRGLAIYKGRLTAIKLLNTGRIGRRQENPALSRALRHFFFTF